VTRLDRWNIPTPEEAASRGVTAFAEMNINTSVPTNLEENTHMSAKARSWLFAATGGLLFFGVTAMLNWPGTALATPAKDFKSAFTRSFFERIRVLSGTDKEGEDARVKIIAKDPSDVYVVTNTVVAGGYSGWHTHPGPSVVLVKSGTATVYDGDDPSCTPVKYPAGTGFIDAGGGHVHMVRNEGRELLVTEAFQVIPAGENRRIDAADPGYCSFWTDPVPNQRASCRGCAQRWRIAERRAD
jgi:hypothetical protein